MAEPQLKLVEFDDSNKKCIRCKVIKKKTEFHKGSDRKDGLHAMCKVCNMENGKKWRLENKDKCRAQKKIYMATEDYKIKEKERGWFRYGIRNADGSKFKIHDFKVMLASQNNKCAICESESFNKKGKDWSVDHDHKTGAVRWILCSHCNSLLGYSKDDAKILRKAADMLEEKKRS